MNKKKWLVVSMVVFLSVFALFGCLPSTNGEPEEEPTNGEKLHIKVILPETTPEEVTEIYLIGSYCDWNFDEARTSEVKTEDGQQYAEFELDFEDDEYPLEYKYTVGPDWEYVEEDENGEGFTGNRRIDFKPTADIQDVVLNWKDTEPFDYTELQEDITVTFIVHVPEGTEDDEGKIYIRGSINNWGNDGGGTPLHKTAEGTYTGEVGVKSYTLLEFKFLRKDAWNYEENVGENRIAILTDDSTITCLVEKWAQ